MKPGESYVKQPVRSLQTMLRVLAENDMSLPTVVPDGIYGPRTQQAVSTFQRKYGLQSTGTVNQQTWEYIVKEYDIAMIQLANATPIEINLEPGQVFRKGDSSPYIYLLQAMLIQLSQDNPRIERPESTGVIDELTVEALAAFQELAGLEVTGEFDRVTWKHIVKQYVHSADRSININQYL